MCPSKISSEDLAVVHGYLCSDGYVLSNNHSKKKAYAIGLRNTNTVLLEDFQKRFETFFGLKPHISSSFDRCSISNKKIHSLLLGNFGTFSSLNWKIPRFISKKVFAFWLRAYFDCDGWVELRKGKNRRICLESINKAGLVGIKKELESKFKIDSIIKPKKSGKIFRLTIFGKENLAKFQKNVGFVHPEKNAKLNAAINSFEDFVWAFPSKTEELIDFIFKKFPKKFYVGKAKRIRLFSIKKANLIKLQSNLRKIFEVDCIVSKTRFNGQGTTYFELSINKKQDIQRLFNYFKFFS